MAKVFLTNATGYIGKAVAKAALQKGHTVSALARSPESTQKLEKIGVKPINGDLKAPEKYLDEVRQADVVIHTAATNDEDFGKYDTLTVNSVIDALKGSNKTFIYTSGTWVLGNTGDVIADEQTPYEPLPFVAWRAENEQKVVKAAQQGVKSIVLRPVIVYGGAEGIIENLIQQAQKTARVDYIENGQNYWSLVHVDDLADLYVLAIEKAQAGSLYNASTEFLPAKEIAELVAKAAGGAQAKSLPLEEARKTLSIFADAFALDQKIGADKAKQELGWQTKAPKLKDELAKSKHLTAGRI
ncbi:MAG TPA: NAD-dependent epimerase/dehydratase family protein [Drouetiella sp.]|jgi:nucleoside-diphosphate-sugar epimerase